MKKILFLYLTIVNLAFGYNYDDILLKAQAAIFPKIVLLDKKIDNKLVDGKIVYTIVHDNSDLLTAQYIKNYIDKKYNGQLGSYKYVINLVDIDNYTDDIKTSAIYVLNLNEKITDLSLIARENGIISFSYDINNLKKGLMFSLVIEKSTVLYMEKDNIYTEKIDFVDALLQMVHFIEKDDYASKDKTMLNDIFSFDNFYVRK